MSAQSVVAATTRLFRPVPAQSGPCLTIPILFCPDCTKHRVMTIKTIVPHLRTRDGVDVEFFCAPCGASERLDSQASVGFCAAPDVQRFNEVRSAPLE